MFLYGTPYGIRTRLYALKGRCPNRIDERCINIKFLKNTALLLTIPSSIADLII